MGPYISFYDSIVGRGGGGGVEECDVLHAHTSLSRRSGNGNNISISHHAAAPPQRQTTCEQTPIWRSRLMMDWLVVGRNHMKIWRQIIFQGITDTNIIRVHQLAFVRFRFGPLRPRDVRWLVLILFITRVSLARLRRERKRSCLRSRLLIVEGL